jgi:hypothetical protein
MVKVEKLITEDKGLTTFHKLVIIYIIGAVIFEFMGAFTRSFFGPLIIVQQSQDFPMSQFAEHYRLLLYSISDFFVGIALLYLFYHQGCLVKEKMNDLKKKDTMISVRYGADGKPKIRKVKAKVGGKEISMAEYLLDNDSESHRNLHTSALQPVQERSHDEISEYALRTDLQNHASKRESINAE